MKFNNDKSMKPVYISGEVRQEYKEYCAKHGYKMGSLMEIIVTDFLKEQK